MSRPAARRDDEVALRYLTTASELVREKLTSSNQPLSQMLGFLGVEKVVDATNQNNGLIQTTGAFYRRWKGGEEFSADLSNKIVLDAFSSPELVAAIDGNLLPVIKEHDREEFADELTKTFAQNCATTISESDPHLMIRWHSRPYIRHFNLEGAMAIASAERALLTLNAFCRTEPLDLPENSSAGLLLVNQIDNLAIDLLTTI
ncbi:MAG TPA: hypothetical protein VMR95_04030 [Candidatus Binatia bacterium]|nr:hypothetical protein [Candidatus Binatia bacterium]